MGVLELDDEAVFFCSLKFVVQGLLDHFRRNLHDGVAVAVVVAVVVVVLLVLLLIVSADAEDGPLA